MDEKQELEWREAQKITISGDLVAAAKHQLGFLAAVDRRRSLYEGPMLDRAIHRYKTCWLPLLAKHKDSGVLEGNLVVPLDCEWIWHCHRLNPVQYKKDCEEFYGGILDNQNVDSSLQGKSKHQTAELWTKLYPSEPFELDYSSQLSDRNAEMHSGAEKTITYDLVSAVKRQSSFYYQVSRPSMHDNRFLEDAASRYKGFLYLIKRNQEKSMKRFCVPTYDIDLIWHSHQLQPLFYCKDMLDLLGKVLEHDDTDSDRSKGKKLDSGFSVTTKQWEDTYGLRYWRAGSMYRGSVPSPLMVTPFTSDFYAKDVIVSAKPPVFLQLPQSMVVEVLLEIVGVKDLPASQKGNLFVTCSKNRPDMFFNGSCTLRITSETGEKLAAGFQCEPTGELVMALVSSSSSNTAIPRPWKTIGTATISLESLVNPDSELSIEKWLELKQVSENVDSKPVCLRVAASFSVPFPAPLLLYMVKAYPISMSTCLFPLHGKFRPIRSWTHFIDDNGHKIISLQMRNLKTSEGRKSFGSNREVVGITRTSRKPFLLAEFAGNKWWLKDSDFSLNIERKNSQDGHIFELVGDRQIKFFHGKKLEFEPKKFDGQTERDSITVVEFSAEHPYGKAVALFDMKSSFVKVSEEWFVLTGIVSAFVLSNMLKEQGANFLVPDGEDLKDITGSVVEIKIENSGGKFPSSRASATAAADVEVCDTMETVKINHSGSCGGGCGVLVKSSGCGGCGAGGCGSGCQDGAAGAKSAKSGGCGGGGCGSGCGDGVAGAKSAGFGGCGGGGCGSGCGDGLVGAKSAKSGRCGSGCGGCGALVGANGGVTGVSEGGIPIDVKA